MARSGVLNKGYVDEESGIIFTGFTGFPSGETGPTAPPVNVDVPALLVNGVLSLTAAVGETLSCTTGNWTGEPTSYAYAWMRDEVVDIGEEPEYVVVAADAEYGITCIVTATNIIGSTEAPPSNSVEIEAPVTRRR